MVLLVFGLLVGLEVKHFIADYLLQPAWILAGKGDFRQPGGYAHAGIHAAFSLVLLLAFGVPFSLAVALFVAEFVVHYALDYAKIHYSAGVDMARQPQRYWALHGGDQLAHQLTYVAMILVVLQARGLA
jgi:hypothetical protein